MLLALQAGAIIAGHSVQFCEERCEVFWSDDSLGIEWCPMDGNHFSCFLGSVINNWEHLNFETNSMFNWCFDAFIWRLFPMTLSGQGQLVNENDPCQNAKWQASRNFPWHYLIPTGDLKVQSARVGINRFDRYQMNKSWQDVFWCFMEPTVYTLSSYPWRHGTAAKLPRCLATMAGLLATIELCLGPCDAWIKERNLEEVNTSKLVAMNIATASLFFFGGGNFGRGKRAQTLRKLGGVEWLGQVWKVSGSWPSQQAPLHL